MFEPVERDATRARILKGAATGAIVGVLIAVVAHMVGIQQLLRTPDLALYLPSGIIGAALGPTRLRPLLWIAATPLVVIVLLVAYTPLIAHLKAPIRADTLPPRVDAIAVLGNGLTPDGLMRSETLSRFLSGLALAERGVGTNVLVSTERRQFGGRVVSDSADQMRILGMMNSNAQIIFVDSVFTTRTEALRMSGIAAARRWSSVAVVTSPLHTRRACATFEAVGFRVFCVPATTRDSGLAPESNAEDRLRFFRLWLYELFATAQYKSNGWIR